MGCDVDYEGVKENVEKDQIHSGETDKDKFSKKTQKKAFKTGRQKQNGSDSDDEKK